MKRKVFLAVALLALMAAVLPAQTRDPGEDWKRVENSPFGTSVVYDIVFGNNTFVAVGAQGKIAYSDTGKTFVAVTNSRFDTSHIRSVAFGGGRFVAVGDAGKAAFSTDGGRTWTASAATGFGTSNILAVAFGANRFVAVGQAGKIAYSTNGQTWTMVPTASQPTKTDITGIAFGNNKFIIGNGDPGLWSSSDGVAWTAVRTNVISVDNEDEIKGVVWVNNMFFAVGIRAGTGAASIGNAIFSRDGVTWTAPPKDSGFIISEIRDIAFGTGKYIAVGSYGMFYSTDNVTWKYVHDYTIISGGAGGTAASNFYGIAFGANKFVLVGARGTLAYLE